LYIALPAFRDCFPSLLLHTNLKTTCASGVGAQIRRQYFYSNMLQELLHSVFALVGVLQNEEADYNWYCSATTILLLTWGLEFSLLFTLLQPIIKQLY